MTEHASQAPTTTETAPRPRTGLVLPIGLMVGGVAVFIVCFAAPFLFFFTTMLDTPSTRTAVPGTVSIVAESERISVFLEHRSNIAGQPVFGPSELPSLTITATNAQGQPLPVAFSNNMGGLYETPQFHGLHVATIETTPGERVDVTAEAPNFSGNGTPVIALDPDPVGLFPFALAMLLPMIGFFAGSVIEIIGIVLLIIRLVRRGSQPPRTSTIPSQ